LSEAPLGVFDSGVGDLTVLKALLAKLPHERFIHLSDTARLPYGTKSRETVARYAAQAAEALICRRATRASYREEAARWLRWARLLHPLAPHRGRQAPSPPETRKRRRLV